MQPSFLKPHIYRRHGFWWCANGARVYVGTSPVKAWRAWKYVREYVEARAEVRV